MHRAQRNDEQLSLRGKISIKDMGTRVEKQKPFTATKKRSRKQADALHQLYAFVQSYLQDISPQILESACSALNGILKNQALSSETQKTEVESVLGPVDGEAFNRLIALCAAIKDESDDSASESDSESDSLSDTRSDSESESSSEEDQEEPIEAPDWCTNPHYLKILLRPTTIKPSQVIEVLENDEFEQDLVRLFNFEFLDIVEQLQQNRLQIYWYHKYLNSETGVEREQALKTIQELNLQPSREGSLMEAIDLDALVPSISSRFAASGKLQLPEGTEKSVFGSYEQYRIPFKSQQQPSDQPLVEVSSIPQWCQPVFQGIETLNRVQSTVYSAAFESSGNLLLCAPTGAGKTNAALLTMLRCIEQHRDHNYKVVYISPLKALVQEQVRTFSAKLQPLGITVGELTGDSNMTSDEIAATQLIITTPEKWDIVTRKTFDVAYTELVKLVIIDEIHLLHDPRGPALENIVARSRELSPDTRLVGLSATLPNYEDVAKFLAAEFCFYFDSTFRPCPLQQTFCGITEKSVLKRHNALNEICLEKVLEFYNDYQSIVFVHSRKDTVKTGKYFLENSELFPFVQLEASIKLQDSALYELLSRGIGVHHAGMSKNDRSLVEQLFYDRKLKVLVSTATLAWGVNLPAHAVIIKGTQVYSPQDGQWEELSPQDILQMLGRAGRPGFDTFGEGIVITLHDQLAYYMSILTSQFPIESQMISRLTDSLNAEVSLGTVKTLEQGMSWLGRTYYFIRMQSEPVQYRAGIDYDDDKGYKHRRKVIVHSALKWLAKAGMVNYNGTDVSATDIGRIASSFYISPTSMSVYMKQLKPHFGPIDILRVFAKSKEFDKIPLRQEEVVEVQKLGTMVPVPIKDKLDQPTAKISILLQAYISQLKLVGMALSADMVYITQSASRLFRAMFELAVAQRWASLALELHQLYLMVDKRMWFTSSPFKQFRSCPNEVIRKTENSPMPWQQYLELDSPKEVAEAIRSETYAHEVFSLLEKFPRVDLTVKFQPITLTLLRLNIEIACEFKWDRDLHYRSQRFLLVVYDGDCEQILHHDWILITEKDMDFVAMQVTVPILDPITPAYFISCISDSWIHSTSTIPLNLEKLIVPEKFTAPTPVRYMEPVDISHIEFPFTFQGPLDMLKSQAYELLYATDKNALIGMADSSLDLAELVFARHYTEPGLVAYIHPEDSRALAAYHKWKSIGSVGLLSGDLAGDLETLATHKIIIASVANMDKLMRKWQRYEPIQAFNVVICDGAHLIGSQNGYLLERTVMRLKFMTTQLELPVRFVALSYSIAGNELGKWFGCSSNNILNYHPKDALTSPALHIQQFDQRDYQSRQKMMIKSVQNVQRPVVIFVPSREICIQVAAALGEARNTDHAAYTITTKDVGISEAALLGTPFIYQGMNPHDLKLVLDLQPEVLIATAGMALEIPKTETVIVLNTQYQDFLENSYVDYTSVQVLNMTSVAIKEAYVYTTPGKFSYFKQFLADPLPVESHLNYYLADTLLIEITERVVDSPEAALDWLTYSYFFHRLRQNPSYYGLEDLSEDAVNEYLSELVESTIEQLGAENIVEVGEDDDMTLTPLDGAFIASQYSLSIANYSILNKIEPSFGLREILKYISVVDYQISMSRKEHAQLIKLGHSLPLTAAPNNPVAHKVTVLLQLHLMGSVPPQWENDLQTILAKVIDSCAACADILCGKGVLTALVLLDLQQMLTQGLWDRESPLKQIPYIDSNTVVRCKNKGIESISDFLAIEDDALRQFVLGFDESDPRMAEVAQFCNDFPAIDIESVFVEGDTASITIIRDLDDEDEPNFKIHTRVSYLNCTEQWYLIVGSTERQIYGAKRIQITSAEETFQVPLAPRDSQTLIVWCICSGYLDADKETKLQVN